MKDLGYLNKYLVKYKFHLIFGALFFIIANFFAIVPAVIVRYAFNILDRSYGIFSSFEGFDLQYNTIEIIGSSIIILAALILISALLRGVFLFFKRQTITLLRQHVKELRLLLLRK